MFDLLIQNFNWPTFILAFAFFIVVSNLIGLVAAIFRYRKAARKRGIAESRLQGLKDQLKAKDEEYDRILGKKETK